MKKALLIITIAMLTFVGKAYADITAGVSVAVTKIDASGTETEGGEKNNGGADNTVVIPSIFIERAYTDTVSIGLDFIPIKADVSKNAKSRTDTETSVTGTKTTTSTTRTQRAQAQLKNHLTAYANISLTDKYFIKAGVAYVKLNTDESLDTGAKYGNEDVFGGVIGIGAREGNGRLELLYTDYEDISLTSSVARTGVTVNNKIEADLDTLQLKYSHAF